MTTLVPDAGAPEEQAVVFFLIRGVRRRVVDARRGMFLCSVCKRLQPCAPKRIARYFTQFFARVMRTDAAIEDAVCLGCRKAQKRNEIAIAPPATLRASKPIASTPPTAPRPAAALTFGVQPPVAPRPAFGQSAFAKATYARKRRPAPGFGKPASSEASFFTPRR